MTLTQHPWPPGNWLGCCVSERATQLVPCLPSLTVWGAPDFGQGRPRCRGEQLQTTIPSGVRPMVAQGVVSAYPLFAHLPRARARHLYLRYRYS